MGCEREDVDTARDTERWSRFGSRFDAIQRNVRRVIQGKDPEVHLALIALFAEGHLLIEDVPGVGKTLLAKSIARSVDCSFRRIQFTPDLLPSDITGVNVFDQEQADFQFRPGAVFANIVLADEINRGSPKTQSALLECMEERQVTVDAVTHHLAAPFMVIATQNPVEHEGTYPLPEAQLDRFIMRLTLGYPSPDAEMEILDAHGAGSPFDDLEPVVDAPTVASMIELTRTVHAAPTLRRYIVDLVDATRRHADVFLGASPRASIMMLRTARAHAAAAGRDFVIPDDVKTLAPAVLSHRIITTADAAMGGGSADAIVSHVLAEVEVPVTDPA